MTPALLAVLLFALVALAALCAQLAMRLHKANDDAALAELEARHLHAELTELRLLYYGVKRPGAA